MADYIEIIYARLERAYLRQDARCHHCGRSFTDRCPALPDRVKGAPEGVVASCSGCNRWRGPLTEVEFLEVLPLGNVAIKRARREKVESVKRRNKERAQTMRAAGISPEGLARR